MNTLLGNILKIIYNNLGIDEGAWMKRLAGKTEKECAIYILFSERFEVQKTRIFSSQSWLIFASVLKNILISFMLFAVLKKKTRFNQTLFNFPYS